MPAKLVGICGFAGCGKNTFAEEFHFFGYKEYAFAAPVKAVCEEAFGVGLIYFTDRDMKEVPHPFWKISPREMAQKVGTELFREHFGQDFWLKRMELQFIRDFDSKEEVKAVITDVRFQNEAQWILDNDGVLVHLTRPGYTGNVGIQGHASERGINWKQLNFSRHGLASVFHVSNEGTKEMLRLQANQLAMKLSQ